MSYEVLDLGRTVTQDLIIDYRCFRKGAYYSILIDIYSKKKKLLAARSHLLIPQKKKLILSSDSVYSYDGVSIIETVLTDYVRISFSYYPSMWNQHLPIMFNCYKVCDFMILGGGEEFKEVLELVNTLSRE